MNRVFKSIWNAAAGTFVAVAENVKAKGKRTKSARKAGGVLATAGALVLSSGVAMADVVTDNNDNSIMFTGDAGTITNVGSITGLTDLTVSGALAADTITVGGVNVATEDDITGLANGIASNGSAVDELDTRVGDNESAIDDLGTRVDDNENAIGGLDTRVGNNEDAISNINTSLAGLGVDEDSPGIKYFRANSEKDDAVAGGEDSVAIGAEAKSEGANSFAAGIGASTTENADGAIALGQGAAVGTEDEDDGAGSVAIGRNSQAAGNSNIAFGDEANVDHDNISNAIAIGQGAAVEGQNSSGAVALGSETKATAGNATALGSGADASGASSMALGNANASGAASLAAGSGAVAATKDSIVLGTNAGVGTGPESNDPGQRHSHIIIGKNAGQNVDGDEAVAIGVGAGSNTIKSQQVAIGTQAGTYLDGERNVSLGYQANHYGDSEQIKHATAIGGLTKAGANAVAVGYNANATTDAVALGSGAKAEDGSIAIGSNSYATQSTGVGYLIGDAPTTVSTVSVGNADTGLTRRITNVEDGAADYDAINVRQLEALKNDLGSFDPQSGGNVNYNPDGTISVDAANLAGQAVNLGQMNTAIADAKPKYISINPNGDTANEDGSGALGADSANSMAIGHAAKVESSERATALGYKASANADDSTALGSNSTVDDASGVAIGDSSYSRGENSVAIGTDAETEDQGVGTTSDNAIAIGTSSRATNDDATALGHGATASGEKSSALGFSANASNTHAMAFGTEAEASGVSAQASGTSALASGTDSQASGTEAKAYAERGIAMGRDARSGQASPQPDDIQHNRDSIAIGSEATAEMNSSTALGRKASATANSAQAFGENATASAVESIAQGRNAIANEAQAVAMGSGAKAQHEGSVALGADSETAEAVGTTNAELSGLKFGNFAGSDPNATVSVGKTGEERTITNVAAGRINAGSTDAINGSQLFATNTVLGNVATSTRDSIGGNTTLGDDGTITTENVGGTGEDTIHDAIEYAAQGWHLEAEGINGAENIKPGDTATFAAGKNLEVSREDGTITYQTADDVEFDNVDVAEELTVAGNTTIDADGISTNSVTTTELNAGNGALMVNEGSFVIGDDTSINMGGNQVTNVAAGTENDHAVNLGQLKDVDETANKGWQLAAGDETGSHQIKPGDTATFDAGKNLEVSREDGTITYQTADDVEFDNVDVAEELTVAGNTTIDADGISTNSVTTTELNAGNGALMVNEGSFVIGGDTSINMGGNKVTNVAAGTENDHAVNLGQLKDVDATANKGWNLLTNNDHDQVTNVAPGDDVDFRSGDNIEITQDGLNITVATSDEVEFESVKSTTVNVTEEITVAGNTTINEGGITTSNLNVSGETKLGDNFWVTNEGDVYYNGDIEEDTHIVNKKYVDGVGNDLTEKGLNFVGNVGQSIHKDLGETLAIVGGMADTDANAASAENIRTVTNDNGELEIQMSKNLTGLESITVGSGDEQTTINEAGVTTNAVTTTTLNAGNNTLIVNDGNFTVAPDTTIDMGGNRITNVAAGENATDAVNVGQLEDGLLNARTEVKGDDKNIVVTKEDNAPDSPDIYTVTIEDDVEFDSVTSKDDDGNETVLNKDGVTVADAAGNDTTVSAGDVTVSGGDNTLTLNAGEGTLTGLTNKNWSDPTFGTVGRAATEEQLKPIGDFLGFEGGNFTFNYNGEEHDSLASALDSIHWNVEAPEADTDNGGGSGGSNGGGGAGDTTSTPINNGNTVGFAGDDNISVTKTEREGDSGADISISLNDDINVNSVTAENVNAGNISADEITINEGGPVINQDGINMNDNRITNVANGIDAGDAVNMSQLTDLRQDVEIEIGSVRRDMHRLDRKMRAGVATAMATAGLPQAYLPGKSMVGVAGATWSGEAGVAVGGSTITDNGKWIFKASGNASTRGDYGGTVGAGYQW